MFNAIYHVPFDGLELCRDLGFTHVNLCLWNGVGEEFYRKAHEIGLHCVVSDLPHRGPSVIDFIDTVKRKGRFNVRDFNIGLMAGGLCLKS